ncbi:RHS repeat-associated core domain-containing protein [Flavobacterium aestivum]|uniref:RHS repeat-associated core domain-containing protein n=1 Tax=Flavobacterium aestivum TaxID=3003257 RepID=UPI002482F671|nr:RHS repeat-associated core domain-containing protein [Flavobacterium aestivum]
MYINKSFLVLVFSLFTLFSFGQQEESSDYKLGAELLSLPELKVEDSRFLDLNKRDLNNNKLFVSVNDAVSIHFGFKDDISTPAAYKEIYDCTISLEITPYNNRGIVDYSYTENDTLKQHNKPFIISLKITHDNAIKGVKFNDYLVYKLPGIHKAKVKVNSITYSAPGIHSAPYLALKFNTDRYYNLQNTTVTPSAQFIKYDGTTPRVVSSVNAGADELLIKWDANTVAPALEYELEWAWIDNFGANGAKIPATQIGLTEKDFMLNSTRIQTKKTSYNIPVVYSSGYIIYRVRPVGRFLDDINKIYNGKWSTFNADKELKTISDWTYIEIDQSHEGKKNWQYQASFAEDGKKKEVVSYFDGSLRNRQTVTKVNSNNKAIVGEVIYDNQGRAAIEVLPVPVEASAIHFYNDFNKNAAGKIYSHKDFDWDKKDSIKYCEPILVPEMANVAGASKYYSTNNPVLNNHQDYVPDAQGYPFSQIEYTPDNTGRIKSKGGVGLDHQIGKGHEMRYFYSQPTQEELNRLFGYKVGDYSRYKKNTVIDPNGQMSVSYLDPQGRTVATALAGDKEGNLDALKDEMTAGLHEQVTTNLLANNDPYASGENGKLEDGIRLNSTLSVVKTGELTFNYSFAKTKGGFTDGCLNAKVYPFVYDWSISLKNDCAKELLVGSKVGSNPLSSKIGVFSLNETSSTPLSFPDKVFNALDEEKFLKKGSYAISKDLRIDHVALESYANDYIKELKDKKICLPDLTALAPEITAADCNVACNNCEQPINVCNLNLDMLLRDVSPHGQYGSVKGLETDDDDDANPSSGTPVDPLSIFNVNNDLLYGGFHTETRRDEGSTVDVTVKVSNYNWKKPFGGSYKEADGTVSKINVKLITKVAGHAELNIYDPALEGVVLTDKDRNTNSNDPNDYLVEPKYLRDVAYFISIWQNSWANSLVQYHPEYQYYVYNSGICSKLNNAGLNSNAFNEELLKKEFYIDETKPIDNSIFDAGGVLEQLLNIDGTNDPFYNSPNSNNETEGDFAIRKDIMKEALTVNFDGMVTGGKKMNMLQAAYYFAVFSNGIAPESAYTSFMSVSQSSLLSIIRNLGSNGNIVDLNTKQRIWANFRSYYLGLKEKTRSVFAHIDAIKNNNYNDCIGDSKSSDNYVDLLKKYTSIGSRLTDLFDALPGAEGVSIPVPPASTGIELACSKTSAPLFANKVKRFLSADYETDPSIDDSDLLANTKKEVESKVYLETGINPRTSDLENLLKGLVNPTVQDQSLPLTNGILTTSMPFLTRSVFDAQVNSNFVLEDASVTPKIVTTVNSGVLSIGFTCDNVSISTPITLEFANTNNYKNPCGASVNAPNWADITDFKNLYYIPGSFVKETGIYQFRILATINRKSGNAGCTTPEEIILNGTTKVNIADFSSSIVEPSCDKREKFSEAFNDLVLDLQQKGVLWNDGYLDISTNAVFLNGYLKTYFGVSNTDQVKWLNDEGGIYIYVNGERRLKIDLYKFNLGNDKISRITINGLSSDGFSNVVKIKLKHRFGRTKTANISSGAHHVPLYFSCCSPCGEWDFDGNGVGDGCDEVVDPSKEVSCSSFAADELLLENSLKDILNDFLIPENHKEWLSGSYINMTTIGRLNNGSAFRYVSSNSLMNNFVEKFKARERWTNILDHYTTNFLARPIFDEYSISSDDRQGLVSFSLTNAPYIGTSDNYYNGRFDIVGINLGDVKKINSIDIKPRLIFTTSNVIEIIYTDNLGNTISKEARISFIIDYQKSINGGWSGANYQLCRFFNEGNPVDTGINACNITNETAQAEFRFENNIRDVINNIITSVAKPVEYGKYYPWTLSSNNTTVTKFIESSNLVELYQDARSKLHNLDLTFNAPVTLNYFSYAFHENVMYFDFIDQNGVFNMDGFALGVDISSIKKINSIDIITGDINCNAIINYNDNSDVTIIKQVFFGVGVCYRTKGSTQGVPFCKFLAKSIPLVPPQEVSRMIKSNESFFGYSMMNKKGGLEIVNNKSSVSNISLLTGVAPVCPEICVPAIVDPVICGDKWREFKSDMSSILPTYELPTNLTTDGNYFCEANFGYISVDYAYYLTKLKSFNGPSAFGESNPLFLTIDKFGDTKLNYGNKDTHNVIDQYFIYLNGLNQPNPTKEAVSWNQFANEYVSEHKLCVPAPMVPRFSLKVPTSAKTPCELYAAAINAANKQQLEDAFYAGKREEFIQNYTKEALEGITETLTKTSFDKEYQYTLYYYDQAGNLIQTVPPEGVHRLAPSSNSAIDAVRKDQAEKEDLSDVNGAKVVPDNTLQTQYRYNSLNQLIWQKTPDGGITQFAYDALGRIVASQNAEQAKHSQLSYTRYDGLGRITEAGQLVLNTTAVFNGNGRLATSAAQDAPLVVVDAVNGHYPYNIASKTEQVTKTLYDVPMKNSESWFTDYGVENSHKRVTAVLYYNALTAEIPSVEATVGYENAILYDYDVHGNVKELIHHTNNNQNLTGLSRQLKKVVYDYDLISGNVNKVTYQPNKVDQFIHKYDYDADNRIQQVYTSRDNMIWEKEANYLYYEHGPLARVVVGDKKVQGIDYIYTLQGWLKGVNSEELKTNSDAGKDGLNVAKDAFGFALNYYTGDYISRTNSTDGTVFNLSRTKGFESNANLYNGNIKDMVTSLSDLNGQPLASQFNHYTYDQLNRIKSMNSEAIVSGVSTPSYKSSYSYDRNGNLKTLSAFAPKQNGSIVEMDRLTYNYKDKTNQLLSVKDAVGAGVFTNDSQNPNDTSLDIDNQDDDNYEYDAIGQLTKDKSEGLDIEWRVDGKVKKVVKNNGLTVSFEYDGLGNRTSKTVVTPSKTSVTYYVRDAQGNVLSTYEMVTEGGNSTYYLVEQDIYGSSRLGVQKYENAKITSKAAFSALVNKTNQLSAGTERGITNKAESTIPKIYGLKFDNTSDYTAWPIDTKNQLNLFSNKSVKTRAITVNSHFKIDPANTENVVAAFHGSSVEGNFPRDNSVSYRSSVLLKIKKEANGFAPIVSLIKYRRNHNDYKNRSGNRRYSFRSIDEITDYKIAPIINPADATKPLPVAIPENEWDFKAEIKLNSNASNYEVVITLNGNVYSTVTEFSVPLKGDEDDSMTGDSPYLKVKTPPNTLGFTEIQSRPDRSPNNKKTYLAALTEMCDFTYTIDNGKGPAATKINAFNFDEAERVDVVNRVPVATTGIKMALSSVNYAETFCGLPMQDKDGDGIKDEDDSCPEIFNPKQEDTKEIALGFAADGIEDACDNCDYPNKDQTDTDGDGRGDDVTINGIVRPCDNCKLIANFDQKDTDVDENGNAKPDGIGDVCDNCKTIYNPDQKDENHNGIGDACEGLDQGNGLATIVGPAETAKRFVGDKQYELSNHLGNVLSVVSDRSLVDGSTGLKPDVLSYSDYYPFGMLVPNRHGRSESYRYGFQGQEKDDEIKGEGNSLNYTYRMHDPRIGRFFSRDPLEKYYAEQTPYQFSSNAPIHARELEGMETAFDFRFETRQRRYLSGEISHEQYKSEINAEASGAIAGALIVAAFYTGGKTLPLLRNLFWTSAIKFSQNQLFLIGAGNAATGLAVGFLDESGTIDVPGPIDDFSRTGRMIIGTFAKSKFIEKYSVQLGKLDYALGRGSTVAKDLAKVTIREIENMAKSLIRSDKFKQQGINTSEKLIGLASKALNEGVDVGEKLINKYGTSFSKQVKLSDGTKVNVSFIVREEGALPELTSFSIPEVNKELLGKKISELKDKAQKLGNNLSK